MQRQACNREALNRYHKFFKTDVKNGSLYGEKRVIVTGGGASGLMAAIAAAENGAAVTILEQNEKPGKKICATGNGKCNFTNIQVPSDAYRSENPGFEQAVLNQFPVEDTVKFFTRLGIFL